MFDGRGSADASFRAHLLLLHDHVYAGKPHLRVLVWSDEGRADWRDHHGVSALCHATIVMSSNVVIRFFAFLLFEACVGLYFPLIGTQKGAIVPEDMRATIYNIYRLPLNGIVLLPLLLNFSITTTFMVTTSILIIATVGQLLLMGVVEGNGKAKEATTDPEEVEAMVIGDTTGGER